MPLMRHLFYWLGGRSALQLPNPNPSILNPETLGPGQVFCVPILRHLFYWLGGRPASRASVRSILARKGACVLIPGGVAEVTEIQHGSEVAFMHSRLGFVKLALEHGELPLSWHDLVASRLLCCCIHFCLSNTASRRRDRAGSAPSPKP